VALLPEHGIIGDTLEVEFDNFKARSWRSRHEPL
jgi:hypothetical protein